MRAWLARNKLQAVNLLVQRYEERKKYPSVRLMNVILFGSRTCPSILPGAYPLELNDFPAHLDSE